jgi:hypothetical protein
MIIDLKGWYSVSQVEVLQSSAVVQVYGSTYLDDSWPYHFGGTPGNPNGCGLWQLPVVPSAPVIRYLRLYNGYPFWYSTMTMVGIYGSPTAPPGTSAVLPASQSFATNECPFCNNGNKVYMAGQGINVYSGNYNYQQGDGQITGAGATLSFERSYNSLASEANSAYTAYNDMLGYGWTHNYNLRLITSTITSDANKLLLIAPRGSQMRFTMTTPISQTSCGAFTTDPAVLAQITVSGTAPNSCQYQVKTNSQYTYVFNMIGGARRLTSITDPQGQVTTLTYYLSTDPAPNTNKLKYVTAGSKALKFVYDSATGWAKTVQRVNNPGPGEVIVNTANYNYLNGNLTSVTDLNSVTYTYTSSVTT